MNCPKCGVDLQGELIFRTFMDKYGDKAKALSVAAEYGATETAGRWGKEIGIYDIRKDRTVAWKCPDCGHEWERK